MEITVETQDLSQAEHDRRVSWVEKNILQANQDMVEAFVSVVIFDENDNVIRFAGYGKKPTPETEKLIRELVGPTGGDLGVRSA